MGEHRRTSVSDYNAMDEIIPNLWIGDLQAARNEKQLRESNIHSVLSAMRGRVNIHAVCYIDVCIEEVLYLDGL